MDSGQIVRALKGLQAGSDIDAVRRAILKISGPTGPVKSYSVSLNTARGTVSCFLETRSPMPDSEVRELGACGFGNGVCFEFALRPGWVPPI